MTTQLQLINIIIIIIIIIGFPTKTLYRPLLSPIRATCPAHLILFSFITQITYSCVSIKVDQDHEHSAGNDLEGTVVSNLKVSIPRFGADSEQMLGELSSQQRAVRQRP